MNFEKAQFDVRETLTEGEHRKLLAKRIEDAAHFLWEAHVGLVGNNFKEKPVLISYQEARVKTEEAMRFLTPVVKSLEEGERAFDASQINRNKR